MEIEVKRITRGQFDKDHKKDQCWLCDLFGHDTPSHHTAHLCEGSNRKEGYYARLCHKCHMNRYFMAVHAIYGKWLRPILFLEFFRRYPDQKHNLKKDWFEMWLRLGGVGL